MLIIMVVGDLCQEKSVYIQKHSKAEKGIYSESLKAILIRELI
jgi:hypothetical protein